jgi:hypothetical protein
MRATRTGSRRTVAARALAGALVLSAAAFVAQPAAADTAHWWYDTYDIAAVQAEGWTGDGVQVAVIGSQINPDLPVFSGQDLTVDQTSTCSNGGPVASAEPEFFNRHDSTVTAYIIGNGQGAGAISGIAPGAEVTFYGDGQADETTRAGCIPAVGPPEEFSAFGVALQRAVDAGARIVTTSTGSGGNYGDADIVANALAKGVVIVAATNNASGDVGGAATYPDAYDGIVAATAVDSAGQLQTDDTGQPYAVAGTTVVAAGVDLPAIGSNQGWDSTVTTTGSSFASPLVAGMLAVVAQRYPDATGNQLVQTLVRNTGIEDHALEPRDAAGGYGYGAAWLTHMLQVDPTQYPDENPLMDKELDRPDADQLADAVARDSALPDFGLTEPSEPAAPDDEIVDPPTASESALGPVVWIGGAVVLALVVIGVVILIIVLTTSRRRKSPQGGTS